MERDRSFNLESCSVKSAGSQQLAPIVTCLGDGHDGIWNIMADIATASARHEILDWYQLKREFAFMWVGHSTV